MASRLGTIVTENLHNALAYKTAKHHAIKPEPDLLLAVSENGSNIKVKLDIPAVELHVLKVSHNSLDSVRTYLFVSVDIVVNQSRLYFNIYEMLTSPGSRSNSHSH